MGESAVCFECGAEATHEHHVVPRCRGGTKTLPLCVSCHSKVHDKDLMTMQRLSQEAKRKKRAAGEPSGRKHLWLPEHVALVQGKTIREAARLLNCSRRLLENHPITGVIAARRGPKSGGIGTRLPVRPDAQTIARLQGLTIDEAARVLDCSRTTASKFPGVWHRRPGRPPGPLVLGGRRRAGSGQGGLF